MTPRTESIIAIATALFRDAIQDKIEAVELAAAEASEDTESDKPVKAKIGIAVSWEAGEPMPEVTVKAKYTVTRSSEHTNAADFKTELVVVSDGGAE